MKKQEILASLIEEVLSGKSTIVECAARYPELAKELGSLLKIAASISPDEVSPSPEFKEETRRRLAEEMKPTPEKIPGGIWHLPRLMPTKALSAIIIALVLMVTAGGTTVLAAQRSLPGDTLYPVKTSIETIQLTMTPGAEAKARLYLKMVQRRISETTRQAKTNREINAQRLEIIGRQMDKAIIELSKVSDNYAVDQILGRITSSTLEQQLELEDSLSKASLSNKPALKRVLSMTKNGNLIAQVAYNNHQYLSRLPSVVIDKVEDTQFMIDGTIISIEDQTWNVGGIILQNVYCPKTTPNTGNRAIIEGIVKGDEIFISRIELFENPSELTRMAGHFRGTNTNGTADISGLTIIVNDNTGTWPVPGDHIELQGKTGEGQMSISIYSSDTDTRASEIGQSGTLKFINNTGTEITITTTGNQIIINISEARIVGERGRLLRLLEFRHMLGRHLRIDGLYKKDGRIYARTVIVEN
jgi:hypothetical protein